MTCFMDRKENKWTGFGESRDEKKAARHNTKQEIIVLWSCHKETRRQPGEGSKARYPGLIEEQDNVLPEWTTSQRVYIDKWFICWGRLKTEMSEECSLGVR